ncbi:hypothetical protein EZV62_013716 [Acer yangbiense]|uniref:CCHC-type domain-containing protein n=1 Tax=Acer yangbiense TaxID=1000413 RepID=A0A5C7HYU7_9ROSI|nr:hypothetical protein EZV62_013716 [Acer yangbiense]
MSLKELEGPVRRLEGDLKTDGVRKLSLCLVGKVLANELINREVFRRVLLQIWKVRESITIEMVRENVFTFHFQNQNDRRRVLTRGPWSFDNFLIVLAIPNGKGDILNMPFNRAAFWVQIHNVSLLCMTKQIGHFLGSLIGDVEEIDEGASGDCDGKFLRVRVTIPVDQPLRRILRVDVLGDGEESVILLRYERLPDHCHKCGKLGHKTIECTTAGASTDLLFGAWLKVGIPIIRPTMQGRVSLRQSSASPGGSSCDGINKASGISQPGSSIGKESQVVVKESGSDGNKVDTAMEGVGKGKKKIDGIMIADSRAVNSISHNGRKLNVNDENTGVAANKLIFEFSSQRGKDQVLNESKVKTTLPMTELGRQDGMTNTTSGPRPGGGKDLCVVDVVSSFPIAGPWALVRKDGPIMGTTLTGAGSSNKSQHLGRWKRVSNKKLKEASQKPSDVLVDVEVCGNYNFIQEERRSKSSLDVVASGSVCVLRSIGDMFTSAEPGFRDFNKVTDSVTHRLSDRSRLLLDRPFIAEEDSKGAHNKYKLTKNRWLGNNTTPNPAATTDKREFNY